MGFAGRFELTVPDILQILSLSRKTGKLTLSRLENSAELLFKNGMVIFATCDSARHTLSNILISQKRLTESALMAALELQHLSSDNKRLGAILIERGIITREVLQEALRSQIEQVMSEFLSWENGFFRFDMTEIAADDGIAIDVSEFLTKSGIQPELLFHEGASPVDGRREVDTLPRPERVEGLHPPEPPAQPERFDVGFDGELSRTAQTSAEPFGGEQLRAVEPLSRMPRPEHVEGLVADLIEGRWGGERPPWIKPESSSSPEPPARPEPAVPRPELVEGLAAETPTPSIQAGREPPVPATPVPSQTSPAVSAGEALKPTTSTAKEQQVPTSVAPSGTSLEGPFPEIEPSRITDEIMLNSPIAPWVLIMHLAADVVSRGVLLFVRKDGITGHDQFGVGGGRDSGDERVINIKIPWNEPSILAATTHARTTYRGKIGPGKWNDYFLGQLGGSRPNEVVIIPIIVAGKVVAIFYGDDAGGGTPVGDVERLQALISQTFSAVEASILEKRGKASA